MAVELGGQPKDEQWRRPQRPCSAFVAIASTKNGSGVEGWFAKENGRIASRLLHKLQSCLGYAVIYSADINILMLCK